MLIGDAGIQSHLRSSHLLRRHDRGGGGDRGWLVLRGCVLVLRAVVVWWG